MSFSETIIKDRFGREYFEHDGKFFPVEGFVVRECVKQYSIFEDFIENRSPDNGRKWVSMTDEVKEQSQSALFSFISVI